MPTSDPHTGIHCPGRGHFPSYPRDTIREPLSNHPPRQAALGGGIRRSEVKELTSRRSGRAIAPSRPQQPPASGQFEASRKRTAQASRHQVGDSAVLTAWIRNSGGWVTLSGLRARYAQLLGRKPDLGQPASTVQATTVISEPFQPVAPVRSAIPTASPAPVPSASQERIFVVVLNTNCPLAAVATPCGFSA